MKPVTWLILATLSVVLVVVFLAIGLPGAYLLGPMAAGIVVASLGGKVQVRAPAFQFSQGVIGLLIAHNVPVAILVQMSKIWPVVIASVVAVVGASSLIGYQLARRQALPGTTAIWGFFPGGSSVMMVMAEEFGGDPRLVAFIQYLRVVIVALVASALARVWLPPISGPASHGAWFPSPDLAFVETAAIAILGSQVGTRLRLPAGALMLPMVLGIVLQDLNVITIELPRWFLTIAYATLGWSVGLRFTTSVLAHAWSVLPRVLALIAVLIAICGLFAGALVWGMHVDPMTAYLATSPGGIDSVAIIAASSSVDMSFVMAMQTARILAVLIAGPAVARWLARRIAAEFPPA